MDYIRLNCIFCTRKHIAQAKVLLLEFIKDKIKYELHFDDAIGHLGEAEDESSVLWPDLSNAIREQRINLEQSDESSIDFPDFVTLQKMIRILIKQVKHELSE